MDPEPKFTTLRPTGNRANQNQKKSPSDMTGFLIAYELLDFNADGGDE